MRTLVIILAMGVFAAAQSSSRYGSTVIAELPRVTVDASYPNTAGYVTKTVCSSGCDFTTLQAAVTAATCSEIISMRAGQTFTGNTTLPTGKGCTPTTQIVIQSDSGSCPASGTRVTPRDFAALAWLVTNTGNTPVIQTAADGGAFNYHIGPCLAATATKGLSMTDAMVNIGGTDTAKATQASNIVIDRMYLYAPDQGKTYRRGVLLNGAKLAIVSSWCENFMDGSTDSQCFTSFGGSGPMKISNNTISGASEGVMFGGAIGNFESTPCDVEITNNYAFKPSVWQKTSTTYMGINNVLKNIFELKTGCRVLYKGNIIEQNWGGQGQAGSTLLITPRVVAGDQGWRSTVVSDITYTYNLIDNIDTGWNISSYDDLETNGTPLRTQRVNISNNVITNVAVRGLQILGAPYVTIDHNTFLLSGLTPTASNYFMLLTDPTVTYLQRKFVVTNNLGSAAYYTLAGTGCSQIPDSVLNVCGGIVENTFSRNGFIDLAHTAVPYNTTTHWPASNRFLADGSTSIFAADYSGFASATNCNLGIIAGCVQTSGIYIAAGLDGKNLGADIAGLTTAIAGVRPTIPQITVASISPTSGTAAGGTPVTITGTNFFTGGGLTEVIIGGRATFDNGVQCTGVVVVSSTSITCTTAAYSGTLSVPTNVTVFNGGTSQSLLGYTFN